MVHEQEKPGWLFGIENLTANASGVIFWRGVEVGFIDPSDRESEPRAKALAMRCVSAEMHGEEVTKKVVCDFSPLASAPEDTPWMEALLHHLTIFEQNGRATWLALNLGLNNGYAVAVSAGDDGAPKLEFALKRGGAHALYMRMMKAGFRSNVRRLEQFNAFVETMQEARITCEMVTVALATGREMVAKQD